MHESVTRAAALLLLLSAGAAHAAAPPPADVVVRAVVYRTGIPGAGPLKHLPPLIPDQLLVEPGAGWPSDLKSLREQLPDNDPNVVPSILAIDVWKPQPRGRHTISCGAHDCYDTALAQDGKSLEIRPLPSLTSVVIPAEPGRTFVFGSTFDRRDLMSITFLDARGAAAESFRRVGGEVKAPKVLSRVEPLYPEGDRRNRVSGIVILDVLLDAQGRQRGIGVLKSLSKGLDRAAVDAVKQWSFAPATVNGQGVASIFNLTINFKLK